MNKSQIEQIEEGIVRFKRKPGDGTWRNYWGWQLFINRGWRDATLLAVAFGSDFLFEYEMPNGRYYLREIGLNDAGEFGALGKSVSGKRLPTKWVLAEWMVEFEWQF